MANKGYSAVVESGSCSMARKRWEERVNCGHLHRTAAVAEKCGAKHYAAKYVNSSWQASATWHGYTVHDQDGQRVAYEERRPS